MRGQRPRRDLGTGSSVKRCFIEQTDSKGGDVTMNKRWMVAIVVLTGLFSLAAVAEKSSQQFVLTITDGGNGFLPWFETISVFPFDPTTGERAEKPVVVVKPVPKVVKLKLPPGHYEIVVAILGYRWGSCKQELVVVSWGKINLSNDQVFDCYKVGLPIELRDFVPVEVTLK